MLKRVLLVLLLSIWANSGSADCWYNGVPYPEGTRFGDFVCLGKGDIPLLSTPVKNWLWLIFGSLSAMFAVVVLYKGAQKRKELRFFAASLYAASAILCMEVFVVLIRFFHF
jgi:hypothetical protein